VPALFLLIPSDFCRALLSKSLCISVAFGFLCASSIVSADAVLVVSDKKEKSNVLISRPFDGKVGHAANVANKEQASAQWALINQIEQLQQEVQQLRGVVEEQAYMLEQFKKSSRDRYLDLDRRISQLNTVSSKASEKASISDKEAAPRVKASKGEKAIYEQAQKNIKAKRFPKAISLLNQLLSEYPDGAYVSNAYYWLGEVNLALTTPNYQDAEIYFLKLLQRDAKHRKAPAALFKLGKLYDLTGQAALAEKYLGRVLQQYPQSGAASLARKYLDTMGSR
jgi:tol-pal system protein YbgF